MRNAKIAIYVIIMLIICNSQNVLSDTYYLSTRGSDGNDGSYNSPWIHADHAISNLNPGDKLIILDGIYYQSLHINISGTSEQPITIKALNDGMAIFDGQSSKAPLVIRDFGMIIHDIIIEGIQFRNSINTVVLINDAESIQLKRISAYNSNTGNDHAFIVWRGENILFEDCAAGGIGRYLYNALDCRNIIFRRCWGRWESHTDPSSRGIMQIYGSDNCIVENCVGTVLDKNKIALGIGAWANTYNASADNNKFLGNVIYDFPYWTYFNMTAFHRTEGNIFLNNVGINSEYGYLQRGDADCQVSNFSLIDIDKNHVAFLLQDGTLDGDYLIKCDFRNSILTNGNIGFDSSPEGSSLIELINDYNLIYNVTTMYNGAATRGINDLYLQPDFQVEKYGKGGYLFVPQDSQLKTGGAGGKQIGAQVLYRYQDGELTDIPLWPWSMEDRIKREIGVSPTWEETGGLWKTLDGVYPESISDYDFSLQNNGNISCLPGSTVTTHIEASLTYGTPEAISFQISGLPDDASYSFTPPDCLPNESTLLSVILPSNSTPADYELIIEATSNEITEQTTLMLNVQDPYINTLTALNTVTPFVIDGILSELEWEQADSLNFDHNLVTVNKVKALSLWDNEYLYFAIEVYDDELLANNDKYYLDDGIEIYIDTMNDKFPSMNTDDYQFIININDQSYSTEIITKTIAGSDGYTMEIAIPWSLLFQSNPTLTNKTLGLLIGNNDRDSSSFVQFDWLHLIDTGSFKRPNLWGDLFLSPDTPVLPDTTPPLPPTNLKVVRKY